MRWLFFPLLLTTIMQGFSQLPANIKFTNYTKANGLPEEQTNSTVQDSRGFIWIGSIEGLFRFDGKNFKSWYANANDSSTFKSNSVTVVDEYLPGKILFFSYNFLWQIDIATHKIEPIKSFANSSVASSPVKINSNLWQVSTIDSIFLTNGRFEKLYGYKITEYFNPNTTVTGLNLHYPYIIARAANYHKLYFYNYLSKQFTPFNIDNTQLDPRDNSYSLRAYDSVTKRLYLANWFKGYFYVDIDINNMGMYQPRKIDALHVTASRTALLHNSNLMLTAGDEGFVLSDFKTKQSFTSTTAMDKPIASASILNIYKDKNNSYWINTLNGISSFSFTTKNILYYKNEFELQHDDEIKSIIKISDENIYILFSIQGLYKINTKTKQVSKTSAGIGYWWGAVKNNNNIILYGGNSKLYNYNYKTDELSINTDIKKFYPSNNDLVTKVLVCKNNDIWYSINVGGGLVHYRAVDNTYTAYTNTSNPPAIPIRYATTAAEDSKGNIWFATNKGHILIRWDAALQKFDEYKTGELLPICKISSGVDYLYSDAADNLWIALGSSGVLKYNPYSKTGDFLDLSRGMPTISVNSIIADNKNRIWMATSKGLACYVPNTGKVVTFTTNDGLPEEKLAGTGIFYDEDKSKLYVGGKHSVAFFNTDSLLQSIKQVKPTVYIEDMQVNGKNLYFNNEKDIFLNPNENNLGFNFAVADFERNNQLEFEYRLTGNSSKWITLGDKRSITLNSLPSGKYKLSARCKYRGAEEWFETPTPISFTIKTPWYKTKWFIALAAIIAIFLIWFLIRQFYRRKLEKQQAILEKEIAIEQERTKMARELHDGLGSMLSGIRHSFTAMKNEFQLDERQQLLFHTNMDKLNETIVELRHISHNMASDALVQFGLENSLRDYCHNLSNTSGLKIVFNALNCENIKQDEVKNMHLFRVVQELLQNIIKHAHAAEALVQLSYNENILYITVEDNGRGFTMQEAKKQKSMGLKNIEARIKLLQGELDYQTSAGKGTSVLITVPYSN